jgi:hypothetical protein
MFGIGALLKGVVGKLATKEVVGSLATSALSSRMQQNEAQKNRNFQADMSNTSYQRAMADMRQAGLNPMLAFSQGGASTPGGATANPEIKNPFIEGNTAKQIESDTNLKDNQSKISDIEYQKAKLFFDTLQDAPEWMKKTAMIKHFNIAPKTFKEGLFQTYLSGSGGTNSAKGLNANQSALKKSLWRSQNKRK